MSTWSYADSIRAQRLEFDWRDKIEKGDVLLSKSGTLRVVRRVSYTRGGFLGCVYFAILHCSWTRRPYTCINRADLNTMGFIPTGAKAMLRSKMDKAIEREIGMCEPERRIYCWDIVGAAS